MKLQKIDGFGPNVIARKYGDDRYPTVLLNGHMDTVDIHKRRGPRVKWKCMYGLGVADMKAGLAIILHVFKNANLKNLNLIFAATVDEEGNSLGAYKLIEKRRLWASLCLIPEPTGEKVILGARGRYVIDIELKTKGGHGARPVGADNAIDDAAKVVKALKKLKLRKHPKLGKGSYCVLKIQGGGETLSVPASCLVRVDRHVVPGESKDVVMKDFKELINKIELKSEVELRWMKRSTPFLEPYIMEQTDLMKEFIKEHREFFSAGIGYASSVGDYNLFAKRMPTIVFGPKGHSWHTEYENVKLESIFQCHRFYQQFLKKLDKEVKKK